MKILSFTQRFHLLFLLTFLVMIGCQAVKDPLDTARQQLHPAIHIITPMNNSAVAGTVKITFIVSNLDQDSLAVVELWVNGAFSGVKTTAATDSVEWSTTSCEDGSVCILSLKLSSDSFQNVFSDPVTVVVNNLNKPAVSELDSIIYMNNTFYISWSKTTSRDFKSYSLYESLRPDFNDSILIYYTDDISDTTYAVSGIGVAECRFYKLMVSDSSDLTACSAIKPAAVNGENDLLRYYFKIWKDLFLNRNQISDDYYNAHLEITSREILKWNSGISFRLRYTMHIDWAEIEAYDDFLVMLFSTESAYQHLNIRRDVYLTQEEITIVLDNHVFSSSIGKVNPVENLLYKNYDQAVAAFQTAVNCDKIFPREIVYYVPGKLPRIDGDPYFIGFGTLDSLDNRCIHGYFNLCNGAGSAHETVCIITN